LAQDIEETRLDRLWRAVAGTDAEADWLRFYEGFGAARLFVPLAGEAGDTARPMTLTLEAGEMALAFDSESRFEAFIAGPTDFATLTGAELARALAPLGVQVALNPGVSPEATVIDAGALNWIAEAAGAEVAVGAARLRLLPVAAPEPALLEALGARLAGGARRRRGQPLRDAPGCGGRAAGRRDRRRDHPHRAGALGAGLRRGPGRRRDPPAGRCAAPGDRAGGASV
jgi:hypothetical protein